MNPFTPHPAVVDRSPGYNTDPGNKKDEYRDNRKLLSVMWTLIGEGVVFPRLKSYSVDGHPLLIDRLSVTARGERVLIGGDEHPLHPGFIKRFQGRAPRISDEVVARMEDAVSCAEKSLLRAALVMVGLAAEETLRTTHNAMVNLAYITKSAPATKNAKDVLEEIQKAVASWPNANDEQHRLTKAIAAAESIRTERNKASHPGVVVDDASGVEELLVLASRQLPVFWEIVIDHAAKTNGFAIT
ncbi:MAG: hypothetical protein IPM79_24385 [Polyangiaceae bacterium]|nr:hypothetical protein [Polyangiaceae bacterium]